MRAFLILIFTLHSINSVITWRLFHTRGRYTFRVFRWDKQCWKRYVQVPFEKVTPAIEFFTHQY